MTCHLADNCMYYKSPIIIVSIVGNMGDTTVEFMKRNTDTAKVI